MKVLVIGGGIGGLAACTGLRKFDKQNEIEIVLVDPKDHIECFWATFRSPFDTKTAEDSIFSLTKYAEKNSVKLIQSIVTKLTSDQATLGNGDVVDFDVCVIATGASNPWAGIGRGPEAQSKTREERLTAMKAAGDKLIDAASVLVVGGGLIGSEVAGEIAYCSKEQGKTTKVTLVHSGEHLCPEFTVKAGAMVQKKLQNLGVTVVLNDKAIEKDGKMVLESSGAEIDADEVVQTIGIHAMNSFLDAQFLDDKGWVEVDDFFQIKGAEGKLFAIGDCCTLLPNSGSQLEPNIGILGHNIKVALDAKKEGSDGKKAAAMKKFSTGPPVFVCSVGPRSGVAMTPIGHTQFMLPWVKNKTMFFFKTKGTHGLEH